MSSEEELQRLRAQRLAELQARQNQSEEQQRAQAIAEAEAQKQAMMRKLLTPEARLRLTNIKMVRTEFGEQLELQLLQLAQSGKVPVPITDEILKRILSQLEAQQQKREINIRRK